MFNYRLSQNFQLLFGSGRDVDTCCFAARLELVCDGDVVTKQAVARHLPSDDSCQYSSSVQADSHLETGAFHDITANHLKEVYLNVLSIVCDVFAACLNHFQRHEGDLMSIVLAGW